MSRTFRVLITGVGLVSPLGASLEEFSTRLENGVSAIRLLSRFDGSRFVCRLAAEVDSQTYHIADGSYTHEVKRAGRFVRYGVAAAELALADSSIKMSQENPTRCALFLGVSTGGLDQMESAVIRQETRGPKKVSPYTITSMLPNMAAAYIALRQDFTGSQYTICGACASGSQALGQAFHFLRSGQINVAIAGGTDGVLTPISYSSFEAMRMLSTSTDHRSTPRPFDSNSDGIIIGEGAAMFILEERNRAISRGARIYGELSGYGTCSGGGGIALQSPASVLRCMKLALCDARLEPSDIDCVFAQAAGIKQGDASELEAFQALFSNNGKHPAIVSIKGHIGHTFAASGPLNLAAVTGAFSGRKLPVTLNLESVSARFADLNLRGGGDASNVRHCLINTYGFGGINAVLIASRHQMESIEQSAD